MIHLNANETNSCKLKLNPRVMRPFVKPIASSRRGISLLEVVLALAILAMASAYLAQSMHIATENALRAESQTQAEMVAESVMSQVVSGLLSTQGVTWTPYSNPNPFGSAAAFSDPNSQWMYMVTTMSTEVQGMLCVQVGVKEIVTGQPDDGKIEFYFNRWIIDPSLGLDTPPTTDTTSTGTGTSSTGSSSTGSTSGGTSTGGVQ
jgi:prepilin-type N-terminal cleavage/methylation domain-containing protein